MFVINNANQNKTILQYKKQPDYFGHENHIYIYNKSVA